MDQNFKELLIARISSGLLRVNINNKNYTLNSISSQELYEVLEYSQIFQQEALSMELLSEAELFDFLIANKFWSQEKEDDLKAKIKELDKLKLSYYQEFFKASNRKINKIKLTQLKESISQLYHEKHFYDHLGINYYIKSNKLKLIYALGLYHNGKKVFKSINHILSSNKSKLIEELFLHVLNSKIPESQFRELARSDPWRSQWSCKEACSGVFGVPLKEHTEDQRQLILSSLMYDSIYKHTDCPSDEIVNDDDALDGWMIAQKRKNNEGKNEDLATKVLTNQKIRESDEIMIVTGYNYNIDSNIDIEQIDSFNSEASRKIKKERFDHLMKKGVVEEQNMPDSQRKMREMLYARERSTITGQV